MLGSGGDPGLLRLSVAVAAVGTEMVVPALLGWLVDRWLNSTPWFALGGAIVGLCGAVFHLLYLGAQGDTHSSGENRKSN